MVADYFTKPLQGALFYKFREQIMGVVEMETILGIEPINHRSVLESDQSNLNNVYDGNKLNKLKSDQPDLESDQSDLESDQSNTTNAENESRGKTGRTTESKQHPRKDNRNWGKPPVEPKSDPPISPDQTKWTKVVKRGRRGNGMSVSLLNQ